MKGDPVKICIQAGHKNVYSGATGAPGERDWTTQITNLLADGLRGAGQEVYVADALADKDQKVTGTDWDLFLAIHYDSDSYNDRGGFTDFPDPSVDQVNERSKYLAGVIQDVFFGKTGIPVKNRSNGNTKYYYMWSALSANTPCVIIECGVGNRKPEDYETLRKYELVVNSLEEAILTALGLKDQKDIKIEELEKELDEMRDSRNKWKDSYKALVESTDKQIQDFIIHRDLLQKDLSEANAQIETLKKAVMTNKTPLNAYTIKERIISILDSLIKGGDIHA